MIFFFFLAFFEASPLLDREAGDREGGVTMTEDRAGEGAEDRGRGQTWHLLVP